MSQIYEKKIKIPFTKKHINIECFKKNCIDEWIGLFAIILGVLGTLLQFIKTGKTQEVSSFSILTLLLITISEITFCIQGYMKRSWTITITRIVTSLIFLSFLIMVLFFKKKKKKDKDKDKDKENEKK